MINKLIVLSYEMSIYLVKLESGQQQGLVYDNDQPMRFNSTQHIRDAFQNYTVEKAEMLHHSPYDEMIGNPDSAQRLGSLPFTMGQI